MRILALFLLALPCWAVIGTPVELDLTDRSTVTRTGNVVLAGVPVPEAAAILDVRLLSITSDSAGLVNIDSHRLVTERWHGDPTDATKSIKFILVAIAAPTLAGSGTAHVYLADRTGADPGTATTVTVNSTDTCADATACTTVSTGVNKYWIRHDSFNLFDQVQRVSDSHNYVTHSSSGGIVAVTSAGTFTSATVPTATPGIPGFAISTEEPTGASTANEDGANLWAQIKVSGSLWNGTAPKFTEVGRLFFFGGMGEFLWKPTHIYSEDMFATTNQPTSFGLILPTTLGNSLTAKFGTLYGTPATTASVSMTNTDDVWISQYDHGNTVSNTAATIGGTASVSAPWYVCNDSGASNIASSLYCPGLNLKGFRIVKGTTTQTDGAQSDGWLSLDDGTNQINVWVRDNWQNYPMELEANGTTIGIYQWPKHGDTHVDGRSTGDLTAVVNYKADMAMAGQTGFGHFWPWVPGAAMNMTPQSPNPNRGIFTLVSSLASQPVVLSLYGANYKLNDTPCSGVGCNFWPPCTLVAGVCQFDSTKAHRIFIASTTLSASPWTTLSGFKLGMYTGAVTGPWPNVAIFNLDGTMFDGSTFGSLPVGCLGSPGSCKVGTIDTMGDSQADSFGRSMEVWGNFTSHGSATPGNDAARWRDTLLFTNPTYFSDTSLVLGHMHAQDSGTFPRPEAEITNYFNNLYKREVVNNLYGIYYGFELYGQVAAGFGNRYFASLDRRRYADAYAVQFFRTGDPTYFHRMQSVVQAAEVEIQHPPQVNVTSAYAGVGLDHTGSAASNIFWDSKHYTDSNNNLVAKHDGSPRCTESWGASVWFPIYNESPSTLTGGGASVNPCSDGQQPWLDYPTTVLKLNYQLTGDPRSKELVQSIANNAIFGATGSGTIRTLALDETSHIYNGGAFGRAFGGCMQAPVDAAEIIGNGSVNYIDMADRCFAANIEDKSTIRVFTQNPTGILYDDNGIGSSSATPSATGHSHYGSHYFASTWSYYSFAEYLSYKGSVTIPHPSTYGSGSGVNTQTALNRFALGSLGYFNTSTSFGGLYTYLFPGRVASDSYAITGDAETLKYIRRALDFHSMGADDALQSTGCVQQGTATLVGDTPSVPPTTICASPGPTAGSPPSNLSTTTNPNATSVSGPDVHDGGLLAMSFPYLEYPSGVASAARPNTPPSFVLVPSAGAPNAPLTWITNCPGCSGFNFNLALRIAVSSDFTGLDVVTPVSGDWSLTITDPNGANVTGVTVADGAGHTYTCSPTCTFKTPTQNWPPAAGGGAGACLVAPAPPSIGYNGGTNDVDNRVFLVTVPNIGVSGQYKALLTYANCPVSTGQIPVASILSMSTGNVDLVSCAAPCSTVANYQKVETGSIQFVNVPTGTVRLQADSSFRFAVVSPGGTLYRGGTTKASTPSDPGQWAIMQNGGWIGESSFNLPFSGKPLASPSPAYYFDAPLFSTIPYVSTPNNPINLTFANVVPNSVTIKGQVTSQGAVTIK